MKQKLNILGAEWSLEEKTEREESRLKDAAGFCDWTTRTIVVERELEGNLGDMEAYIAKVKRHEIVHAFLLESGLSECSPWAPNEEMVDWFARQGLRIIEAWRQADAMKGDKV